MRAEQSRAESKLWHAIRDRRLGGWKWRRQVPVGPFFVDFLSVEAALVLELDGEHHADQAEYDRGRTEYLRGEGLRVRRFANIEVLNEFDRVCRDILATCGGPKEAPPS